MTENLKINDGSLPQEQFNIEGINLDTDNPVIALNIRDQDLQEGDIYVARLFVNDRFVKRLNIGTWVGPGGNYGPTTALGMILERSLVNQAKSNEEIKTVLTGKGYSFEEPKE